MAQEYVPSKIKSTDPLHEPRLLTQAQRDVFRRRSRDSHRARAAALAGAGAEPLHDINVPRFNPCALMPRRESNGLSSLSMFSGGGGLDLGFDLAGFAHIGSWEIMQDAAVTLRANRPQWTVHGGDEGDVRGVDWKQYRSMVDVLHGGPPCQPFSNAGRQRGASDPRDMWPEFVRAVLGCRPEVFVAENVAALMSASFSGYVNSTIINPLSKEYRIHPVIVQAYEFGVPQIRRRVVFFGFRTTRLERNWVPPRPGFRRPGTIDDGTVQTMGVREALGLPDIGFDDVSPTIRSTLTGPRHTTSILSSVSAQKKFQQLGIWPNGVAETRDRARAFVAKNGDFRLSVPDVALIQGFPEDWRLSGAVYMQLGQIGNAVAPPVGYAVACSAASAFAK
ncbi:MAG: DNA (cytosine-5-)-methyltransferase [Propionibacteriaceae bacterium]|jgi:DNA (cytosine-5)-methyltransferase 1|nr:DNA (cytosine-5-)-methyltransferase [Propionibacteriaceae bacterium]